MADENLESSAADAVQGGGDIQARVRDLTLAALRDRRLDFAAIQSVMRQVGDGISVGAGKHGAEMKSTLAAAFKGMDEAIGKSAQNAKLTLEELASKGRETSDAEWKSAFETLSRLEGEFVTTVSRLAERTGGAMKDELQSIAAHATRTGTDTGASVAKVTTEFAQRMSALGSDATKAGFDAAKDVADRLAQMTSGFLAGVSDAIQPKKDDASK